MSNHLGRRSAAVNFVTAIFIGLMLCNFFPLPSDLEAYSFGRAVIEPSALVRMLAYIRFAFIAIVFTYMTLNSIRITSFYTHRAVITPFFVSVFLLLMSLVDLILYGAPDSATRELIAESFTISAALCLPYFFRDAKRLFGVVFFSLALCLWLSYAALVILPDRAIHFFGAGGEDIVLNGNLSGLWKGIFTHKNIAGGYFVQLLVASVILFIAGVSRLNMAIVGWAAIVFLYFSGSVTALSIPFLVLPIIFLAINSSMFRRVFPDLLALLYVVFPFLFIELSDILSFSLDNRELIWRVAVQYSELAPYTGHGFMNGFSSEQISMFLSQAWMRSVGHAHSGLLDIYIQFGVLGIFLVYIFTRSTLRHYCLLLSMPERMGTSRPYVHAMFGVFLCGLIRSMVEPDLFTSRGGWFIILLGAFFPVLALGRTSPIGRGIAPRPSGRGSRVQGYVMT